MQPFSDDVPARPIARRKRGAPPVDPARSSDFITALARGLDVLRCFKPGVSALGNLELAALTGLPKPTISRITFTLKSLGYLRYDGDTGRYSPGYGVLALGFGALAGLDIRQVARPAMEQLAAACGGAVALGVFDRDAMTYLEAVHGSPQLYLRLPVGYRVDMRSAMGRAHLAQLAPADRHALLAQLGAHAPAPDVVDSACRDLALTGCCFAIGEWQSDINAVAIPFASPTGDERFVISCGGPAALLPEALLRERIAPALRAAVAQFAA